MIYDFLNIILIFILGTFFALVFIIWGLKVPLKKKCLINTCDYCNEKFNWYELIPVISYFINKGKCRHCYNKLSLSYMFLELFSGILFCISYLSYGLSYEMIIMLIIVCLFNVITVSDLRYYIILDSPLLLLGILVLILKFVFFGSKVFLLSIVSGFLIFVFMLVVKIIGDKIFKTESLGGGDIKLSVLFGIILGVRLSVIAIVVGSFLAFPFAVYATIARKEKEIPFGPFLVVGLGITFMFMDVLNKMISYIF